MNKQTYKEGEILVCPHCGKGEDNPVEDYVVQGPGGKIGHPYHEQCGWCDEYYTVAKTATGDYEVRAI